MLWCLAPRKSRSMHISARAHTHTHNCLGCCLGFGSAHSKSASHIPIMSRRLLRSLSSESDDEWLRILCRGYDPEGAWLESLCRAPRPTQPEQRSDPASGQSLDVHDGIMNSLRSNIYHVHMVNELTQSLFVDAGQLSLQIDGHVHAIIRDLGGIVAYKIGITGAPSHRMTNPCWGYECDGFEVMHLCMASVPCRCADLERRLISAHKGQAGCRNEAPGGENAPTSPPCYLYVVFVACGDGVGILQKQKRIARGQTLAV